MKGIFIRELQSRNIPINQEQWLSHPIRWADTSDSASLPHIFLVGDAFGIEPAFGGGIHFALSYGDLAAKEIIHATEHDSYQFTEYKQHMKNHLVGKFMNKCTNVAKQLYSGKMEPFEAAKHVFVDPLRKTV
jgi:flavin-dependent dehydrogenase